MNKATLLGQLHIDRSPPPQSGGDWGARVLWILGGVIALAAVAAAAWFLIARPDRLAVEVATAQAASSAGGAAQGASLLDASGYVVARRQATVSSKITGKVQQVLIEEGQHVAAGEVIARLDDSNAQAALAQAQAQAQQAASNLKLAQVSVTNAGPRYKRSQSMFSQGYLSAQSVEDSLASYDTARAQLEVAQRQVAVANAGLNMARRAEDDTVVRAPFPGVVTVKAAQPGEMVSPISAGGGFTRTGIGTIVDMDSLEVEVDVAESFINKVQDGMPATVKLNAYPDWQIPAEVIAVIPTADRSKATVSVRVGFKQKDARIVPEMGARVSFLSPVPSAAAAGPAVRSVTVPAEAIKSDGADQGEAFVVSGDSLERRAVRLGQRSGSNQVIIGGLSPGDQVAVGDLDKMHDGQKVRVKSGG